MPKTQYSECFDLNPMQREVMKVIIQWVREQRTPVPQKEIVSIMQVKKIPVRTVTKTLHVLIQKHYIRRGYTTSNRTFYVQLRNI